MNDSIRGSPQAATSIQDLFAQFAQFAREGKALSDGNRLELLEFLAQGERGIGALSKVSGLSVAKLRAHGVEARRYEAGVRAADRAGRFAG